MWKSRASKALILALASLGDIATAIPIIANGSSLQSMDGDLHTMFAAPPFTGTILSRTGWTVTCDSVMTGNDCAYAIDGNNNTFWHTVYAPPVNAPLPHNITVDMKKSYNVNGIAMLPRQDGKNNGDIAQHQVFLSTDGVNWGTPVAFGNWYNDQTQKFANFETKPARYVRLVALSEVLGRQWTSIAELNVYAASSYTPPANGIGRWGPTIDFPLVPVEVALEPLTGKVLVWSSYAYDQFTSSPGGYTLTATYDPATGNISQRTVSNTGHDMFCPGISQDFNGRIVVTGGNDADKTSIYDFSSDSWIAGPGMQIPRGYQSSATVSDGRIFTIGGSWSGGEGGKNGEIYSPSANTWTLLPQCPVAPMLTNDAQGVYRQDNHGWLFAWKSGSVFQAGPSKAMNWYTTTGSGGVLGAGTRTGDNDAMCGIAVMYDAVAGKILSAGGSPNYQGSASSANARIITIGAPNGTVTVANAAGGTMAYNRIFHNSAVLPDGTVFITGGQQVGNPFGDTTVQLTPEMYSPSTNSFKSMASNTIPRVYHSWALLMPDATVLNGGGGLCGSGCSTNHFDAQVYTPQYLLTATGGAATRPVINSISVTSVRAGGPIVITTNGAVTSASLIRFGTNTHTVNTDQRRIALTLTNAGTNKYTVTVPSDPGIALPGYWMLFVLNSAGVPSVAKTVQVTL